MKYLFSILILLISLESISQTDEFIIRGKFRNIKATAVDLMPVLDGVSQITKTEVFENSDSFMIKGLIAQPHLFRLVVKPANGYYRRSSQFFIDKGNHDLQIVDDSDIFNVIKVSNSITQDEYETKFLPFMEKNSSDSKNAEWLSTIKYVEVHPESFVSVWMLYELLNRSDDKTFFTNQKPIEFKEPVSNSKIGILCSTVMSNTFKLKEGSPFPKDFFSLESNKKNVSKKQNIKFTLIDFWFSNCGPCISQMPTLVKLFDYYKNKGFQIISICSDAIENKSQMKKVILEQKMTWENLFDINRKKSLEYGIHYFPTNYLLDNKGVIIKKNISLIELESLLKN